MSTGLEMYSDAPAARHVSRSPFIAFAVSAMIGSVANAGVAADAPDRLVTVHLRHHDVHEHDVDVARRSSMSIAFHAALGGQHVHAGTLRASL